jgi:hypothetical protein
MSSTPVDDWTLVREKFEALVRERSDNIDDLLRGGIAIFQKTSSAIQAPRRLHSAARSRKNRWVDKLPSCFMRSR